MYLTRVCMAALAAANGAFAWPTTTSEEPSAPSIVGQANFCGNGVTPYCCNNEVKHGGEAHCTAMGQSSICDTTIVCCNADHSIQRCIGDININNPGGPPSDTSGAPTTTPGSPSGTPSGTGSGTPSSKPSSTPSVTPTASGSNSGSVSPSSTPTSSQIASTVDQSNQCGNNITPYCCNNEAIHGGEANCSAMGGSSICDTTIICCNADHSIQVCIGDIIINNPTVTVTPTWTHTHDTDTATVTATVTPTGTDTVTATVSPTGTDTVTATATPTGPGNTGGETVTVTVTEVDTTTVCPSNGVITETVTVGGVTHVPVTTTITHVETVEEPTTVKVPTTVHGVPTTVEVPTTTRVTSTAEIPVTVTAPVPTCSGGGAGPAQSSHPAAGASSAGPSSPLFTGAAPGSGAFDGSKVAGVLGLVALIHINL